jgi:hypothetical protein
MRGRRHASRFPVAAGLSFRGTPSHAPAMPAIEVAATAHGTLTYVIEGTPQSLPPVRRRDLLAAWDDARAAALHHEAGPRRAFRFARADGLTTDLALADRDASVWAGAVDRTLGIANVYGLSVCLRLLALVDLLAAPWARGLFALRRGGADLDPGLVRLAAEAKLTEDGGFDATAFRAALIQPPSRPLCAKDPVP